MAVSRSTIKRWYDSRSFRSPRVGSICLGKLFEALVGAELLRISKNVFVDSLEDCLLAKPAQDLEGNIKAHLTQHVFATNFITRTAISHAKERNGIA